MTDTSPSISAVALALCASALYGTADFFGGLAARRSSTFAVVLISQAAGLAVLAAALAMLPPSHPRLVDLGWGAAAGAFGTLGIFLLYEALATGRMSTVAPVTGVWAVAIPVLAGLAIGERPLLRAKVGLVFALAAIVLVAQDSENREPTAAQWAFPRIRLAKPVVLALISGIAIGGFYICLKQTRIAAGAWPILAARTVSSSGLAVIGILSRRRLTVPRAQLPQVVAVGVLDMGANVLYTLAAQRGLLSLVATITSLYPAATIIWARLLLSERIRLLQGLGLGFALIAVLLIAA